MKIIKALVVDDEPLAREIIETHLEKVPNWEVIGTCVNAEDAYEALLKYEVDVLFLDIEMPVISGIEFLQSLQRPPLVIFTTAYSEYALQGFDLNVIDYLLKPISFPRFFRAIEKVHEKMKDDNTRDVVENSQVHPYFFVKHDGKLVKILFSDILYIKAEQEYSYIYTRTGKLLVSMHLKLLESILPQHLFTRIHRSYIIPHENAISIYGNTIKIENDLQLPIGNKYKENLLRKLNINQ
ncbi:LytR/AlgR family response regulator transcription factor [Spongiimicrobium salis]|uniref:LytR/AlgR family response regulator transcription factor n=1 Tax=Spongiimicrobium salis TaxID=1667022 RepID=UPI00374D2F32